jgi:LacI family transcriptional regulator
MQIRIKDIAEKANVSTGTVDRVIHNRNGVSGKTKKKVLQIIDDLNFEPDIIASTLAQKKTYHFAILLPKHRNDNHFWKYPVEGIERALNDIKYFHIELHYYFFDQDQISSFRTAFENIIKYKPDGIIIAPIFVSESSRLISVCDANNIPFVFINSNIEGEYPISYIGQNAFQSGYLAAKLMHFGLNEKDKILLINLTKHTENISRFIEREKGFISFFDHLKAPENKIVKMNADEYENDLKQILCNHLADDKDIKGVFVTNSRVHQLARIVMDNRIKGLTIIGYDLLKQNIEYLKKGVIDFLISQKPIEQGYRGLMTLFNSLVLKKEVQKTQHIPLDIITKENLDYYNA